MEEEIKQNSKTPLSTTRLANLLKNPDLLSMHLNYQSTREAFLDIALQLDDFQRTMSLFEEAESRYMKLTDMKSINQSIQKMNVQMDRNNEDLSTEIRELRQYFSFQIKELNTKVDHNLTNVINELTKPMAAAPAPANIGEASIYDADAYKSLKTEMDNLKERFESLMNIISKPMTEEFVGEEEDENTEVNANDNNEENSLSNQQSPKLSQREDAPTTPTSLKGDSTSVSPKNDNEKDNSNNTTSNEENIDLKKDQSSTSSNPKFEKSINESVSSPSLVTAKQIASNLKSNSINAFKKIIEMRLDDIKIQINKLNSQITESEEKLNPLIPVVQRNSAENSILRPELMKLKADVMLLKGDIDIMKDLQANSSVDFMKTIKDQVSKIQSPASVDIEKPLTAMRSQIMQQFARMENAFNEQLRKLKAEIIGVKNLALNNANDSKSSNNENESANQSLLNEDDDQIKVADTFANEEPAEKALLEQMQKEAEEERKKKEEEFDQLTKEAQEAASLASARAKEEREKEIELIQKSEEEKFLQQSAQIANSNEQEKSSEKKSEKSEPENSLKQAEVETDADESSKVRFDQYTEVKNLPNQLIVSVLADLPPKTQKVKQNDDNSLYFTDESENMNKNINVYPTVAFEYARIGSSSDDDLENVKKDIQCHQEIIEKIVSQIADIGDKKIEVPSLSSVTSHEKDELFSLTEIKALKDASASHQQSIEDLSLKVDQLITLSKFANLSEEEKKDKKILEEIIQHQNELKQLQASTSTSSGYHQQRQIVLSPVHFTPLNLEPLKVYKAKSGKDKSSMKPKQSKNEAVKPKNPKRPKKQPSKEAPAPALSSKSKEEATVTIEVPPKPPTIDSKISKQENKAQSQTSDLSTQQKQEESQNQSQNENEAENENNPSSIENSNETENIEADENENEIDDENKEIYQNEAEEETHKSSKSSHRSGSHHSSRHSSRHHSPSHHSSRTQKVDTKEEKENQENENNENNQKEENQEIKEENDDKNKNNEEEEEKKEEEKSLLDEEEEQQHLSNNSVEFFSPADSSVGSSVVYETNHSNIYEEEEEEEEEGMDPILAEKLTQLSDLLNSHQEQIKNIREGLVEIRSTVQQVKMEIKDQRSTLMLPQLKENSSVESLERSKSSVDINQQIGDDNAIRAVRRRFDMQTREFENELYEIRKEIMEIRLEQSKAPQAVTERIIQVPVNGYGQNNQPVPSSPENNNDEDESKGKKKGKKEGIFTDENKLLEIKPLSLPNKSQTPNKVPKLPIIDQQSQALQSFTPSSFSAQQGALMVTNAKQTRTQPTTPKQKKLPPILPNSASSTVVKKEKEKNDKNENENENQTENETETEIESNLTQKSLSARVGNNNSNDRHPFFNNIVHQSINELNVLNAANDVDEHILNLVIEVRSQLMLAIDKNTKRLNQIEAKIENFVDKDYVQKFFQKMRAVITDVNSSVNLMKQALPERVTKDEMQNLIEELYHNLTSDQETSGGTSNYRCLLCGRPKTSISGMIKDFKVAESLGQPTQTTITQSPNAGARGTLIYGPDKQLYRGKGNFGRPTIANSDSKKQLPKMK